MSNVIKSFAIKQSKSFELICNKKEKLEKNTETVSVKDSVVDEEQIYEQIIKEAENKAELLLRKARKEAENILRQSWDKGYKQGYEEGLKNCEEKYQAGFEENKRMKDELVKARKELYRKCEKEMLSISIDIAKKIIDDRVSNNNAFMNIAKKTLNMVKCRDKVCIKVSSTDYENAVNNKNELLNGLNNIKELEILPDESMKKGDCIVESSSGIIDSKIDTQLNAVKKAFGL